MASKPLSDTKVKDKEFFKEKEIIKEFQKEKEHKEKHEKEHKEKEIIKELQKEHKEKELGKDVIKEKPEKEHKDKDKDLKDTPEKVMKDKDVEKIQKDKELEKIQKDKDKEIEKVHKDKDVEKVQKDKDKDAEFQPGGDPTLPQAAHLINKFHGKEHIEKVQKDVEKVQKDKEIDTAAHAAGAGQAAHKFPDKIIEKTHKDFKEFKFEKVEKFEKHEKFEIKEWDVAGPAQVGPGDPVEQRVAALEATVAQLMHFIPAEMRPNLSTGALAQEEGTKGAQPSKAAPPAAEKSDSPTDKGKK